MAHDASMDDWTIRDDKRLQKETFIYLVGHLLILSNDLINSTLKQYRKSGNHVLAHEKSH